MVIKYDNGLLTMKFFIKLLLICFILSIAFMAGFQIWGAHFENVFSQTECSLWFGQIRPWAWAVGIGFLLSDLLLPIPATGIMAALGSVYGTWMGTLIATAGSAAAGLTGYSLARLAGKKATRFLATDEELDRFRVLFNSWGGAAIIVSRSLPILPEVMTLLAGFAGMSIYRFMPALLMGTLPTCFLYAYLGHISKAEPGVGMLVAILAPLFLWPVFLKLTVRHRKSVTPADS